MGDSTVVFVAGDEGTEELVGDSFGLATAATLGAGGDVPFGTTRR